MRACGSQLPVVYQHLEQHALRLKATVTGMDLEGLLSSSDTNTALRVQVILWDEFVGCIQ